MITRYSVYISRLLSQLLSFFLTTLIKTAAYRPTITVRSSLLLVLISAMNCFPPLTLQHLICYGIMWWKTIHWMRYCWLGWLVELFIYLSIQMIRGTLASWLVHSTLDWVAWVQMPWPGSLCCVLRLLLYSHSASLHPGVQMSTSKYVGGNSAMD